MSRPPRSNATAEPAAPSEPSPAAERVPPSIRVPPVYVLAPLDRISVLGPVLTSGVLPPTTPVRARVEVPSAATDALPPSVTGPPHAGELFVERSAPERSRGTLFC